MSQSNTNKVLAKQKGSSFRETPVQGSYMYRRYKNALNRLKTGSGGRTYQSIAEELTRALDDGRVISKADVWKMYNDRIWSFKVCDGLVAAGYIKTKKRYRLHVEFESQEELEAFTEQYKILNFTRWVHYLWENNYIQWG